MSLLATWIWQGISLTMAVAALVRLWRPGGAARGFTWWTALLAVLSLPLPWLASRPPHHGIPNMPPRDATIGVAVPVPPDAYISVAIGIWLGAVLLGLVTLLHGFVKLRRVKARCYPLGLPREQRLRGWMAARRGRSARLCLSDDVPLASALGLGSPVIAVNASLASALDDRELDQLVLHEYAHLERFDDWAQLFQAIVESFCGLHPAVWWIGRTLRFERESAADEWVLRRTGSPHEYAACLATIADATLVDAPGRLLRGAGGLGVSAGLRRGELLRRVERILGAADRPPQRMPRMACATMAVALAAGVVGLRQLPVLVHVVDAPLPPVNVKRDERLETDLRRWPGIARQHPAGAATLRSLRASPPPPVPESESVGSRPPQSARSVRTLPAVTARLTTNSWGTGGAPSERRGAWPGRALARKTLQPLDAVVVPRRLPRDSGDLLLLDASPLETAALAQRTSPETAVSLRGLRAGDDPGKSSDDRRWLRVPSFAKRTSATATKTATSLAKATAEGAVGVGGLVADFSSAGAAQSVGWVRRRLGFG
ncbi:MAG: M56 family metallopeptidase, partial [Vicinamibacteraceae bacterium]